MRFEGNEAVEQRLDHVALFVLVARRASAEIVEGEPFAGGLLNLVPEQERAGGVSPELAIVRELSVIVSRLWQIAPLWVASTVSPTLK